jgi:hypothetical protein
MGARWHGAFSQSRSNSHVSDSDNRTQSRTGYSFFPYEVRSTEQSGICMAFSLTDRRKQYVVARVSPLLRPCFRNDVILGKASETYPKTPSTTRKGTKTIIEHAQTTSVQFWLSTWERLAVQCMAGCIRQWTNTHQDIPVSSRTPQDILVPVLVKCFLLLTICRVVLTTYSRGRVFN